MKKREIFKRGILSILLSLSMVVTPLASTGSVVFAADSATKTLYTQDFSKVTKATSVASSPNAETALSIAKDNSHGNYLKYDLTSLNPSGGRGAVLNFTNADTANYDTYVVEFDAAVKPGNNKETGFGVSGKDIKYVSNNVNYGAESGYILYLVNAGANSTTYTVKGTKKTVTIPSGEWCHYKLSVDNKKGTVTVNITGINSGNIAQNMEVAYSGAGKASSLYLVPGRYNGAMSVDNISVKVSGETNKEESVIKPVSTEYYVIAAATGNRTTVDTSKLSKSNKITGYQVTTAKNGVLVKQEVVKTRPTTVNTTGADSVEIAPVFYYDIGVAGEKGQKGYNIPVVAGSYDFLIYNTSGQRCDVYADDQLLVNNILQNGSTPNYFAVKDIVLADNTATISTTDYSRGKSANNMNIKIQIVKSATIVDRTQKVYVLGDSLVAVYYNNGSINNNVQTGWGQVLENYLVDTVDVVDLANSGATASVLYGSAFSQIKKSAKAGDILLLESGYNDRTYDTEKIMKTAVTNMVNEAEALGVKVILVSPNASDHDYKKSVAWTSYMADVARAEGVDYIDLSQRSYNFLYKLYGNNITVIKADYNVADRLHSTFKGANKWASVVAGAMYEMDAYRDLVDTNYSFTFVDSAGNVITCKAVGAK